MAMTRDCKSLAFGLRRFESYLQHHASNDALEKQDIGFRPSASMRVLPPAPAAIAQSVERIHGKDEVTGSNPVRGSIFFVLNFVMILTK